MISQDSAATLVGVGGQGQARWVDLGTWLTEERTRRGLTRAEIAKRAGVSPSTLATLEAGGRMWKGTWNEPSPTDGTLVRIADALEVDRQDLFKRAGRGHAPPAVRTNGSVSDEPAFMNKLNQLSERDRRVIESAIDRMVDEMLGEE